MFEFPQRNQTTWASVDPPIVTSNAGTVAWNTVRREGESSYSDGFIAFPLEMMPGLLSVRLDFGTILTQRYRSEQIDVDRDAIWVQVADESSFKTEQLGKYPHEKVYDRSEDAGRPQDVFRHFRLFFGDYGQIDILARHARAIAFERSDGYAESQFDRHRDLLEAALKLGWSEDWP